MKLAPIALVALLALAGPIGCAQPSPVQPAEKSWLDKGCPNHPYDEDGYDELGQFKHPQGTGRLHFSC
jgi:hypothetical protein